MIAFLDTITGRIGVRTARYRTERATTMATQRHTTSSRRPGVDTGGSHVIRLARLQSCPKCGGRRYGSGPHSPHFTSAHVQVDCAGEEVTHAR